MWQRIIHFFERAGKARAVAELTRMGLHEEARKIMLGDTP